MYKLDVHSIHSLKPNVLVAVLGFWNLAMVGTMIGARNSVILPNENLF